MACVQTRYWTDFLRTFVMGMGSKVVDCAPVAGQPAFQRDVLGTSFGLFNLSQVDLYYRGSWLRVDSRLKAKCLQREDKQRTHIQLLVYLTYIQPTRCQTLCKALNVQAEWDKIPAHVNLHPSGGESRCILINTQDYFRSPGASCAEQLGFALCHNTDTFRIGSNWAMSLITLQTEGCETEECISKLLNGHF